MASFLYRSATSSFLLAWAALNSATPVLAAPFTTEATAIQLRERAVAGGDISLDFVRPSASKMSRGVAWRAVAQNESGGVMRR